MPAGKRAYVSTFWVKIISGVATFVIISLITVAVHFVDKASAAIAAQETLTTEMESRGVWMLQTDQALRDITQNQRLIICEIKRQGGDPCKLEMLTLDGH